MKTLLFLGLLTLSLFGSDIVTIQSKNSVKETMDKVEKILKSKNYYIFSRVSHPKHIKENSRHEVDEESEVILFDKPEGTKHMYTFSSAVMLEVPFKIAAYKTLDEEVFLTFRSVDAIIRDHKMQDCKFLQKGVRKLLNQISKEAVK